MKPMDEARLTGIIVPQTLIEAREQAEDALKTLEGKIVEHERRAREIDIIALEKELARAVATGQKDGPIRSKLAKAKQEREETESLVGNLKVLVPNAKLAVHEAEQPINAIIGKGLLEARQTMFDDLERACRERAETMVNSRDGKPRSNPPKNSSTSTLAVCERCRQPIAIIRPEICQPMRYDHFDPLPRQDYRPFLDTEPKHWQCPSCGVRQPWFENDKILTNGGFRMVPEAKVAATPDNPEDAR